MIAFEGVTGGGCRDLTFVLGAGEMTAIVTPSPTEADSILRLIVGLARPEAGRVLLLGREPGALTRREHLSLLREIGVVPQDGGLISNLKVWENVILPAWYHEGAAPDTLEGRMNDVIRELGPAGGVLERQAGALPSPLPFDERRIVAVARTMLMDPQVALFSQLFDGMDADSARELKGRLSVFLRRVPGRCSVFITPDPRSLDELPLDRTIETAQGARGEA